MPMMMRTRCPRTDEQAGFSLVELLVVLVLVGVIGGIVTSAIVSTFRSAAETSARLEATNELRVAMQRISRDFRTADEIIIPASADLSTDVIIDIDTDSDSSFEVQYRVVQVGDERFLERSDTGQTLITSLGNKPAAPDDEEAVFKYLTESGERIRCDLVSVDNALCVRAAQIEITMIRQLPNDSRPVEVSTRVTLRNVRYRDS